MIETVGINGLTLCHKHSDGWVRSTLPDVCKAPTIPVPFVNVAFAKDLAKGTKTVFSHGGAMNGIKGSEFSKTIGDEPGVGRGVKSGRNLHRATFLSWSPDVFMEGKPVTRLTDRMLINKGNTISAGGYYTGPVNDDKNEDVLEEICKAACECLAAGTMSQKCVNDKMESWASKLGKKLIGDAAYKFMKDTGRWVLNEKNGQILKGGGKRPDFTDFDNQSMIEVKLPKDRFRKGQDQAYDDIAADNNLTRENVHFKDCDCEGKGRTAEERKAAKAAEEEAAQVDNRSFAERHPVLTGVGVGVLVVGAAAATWWAGGSGGAAVAGMLGLGGLAAAQ